MDDDAPASPPGLDASPRAAASFFAPLGAAAVLLALGFTVDAGVGVLALGVAGVLASVALHAWLGPRDREAGLRGGFLGLLVGLLVGVPVGAMIDFAADFCTFCDPAPHDLVGYAWGAGIVAASVLLHLGVVWLKGQAAPARPA